MTKSSKTLNIPKLLKESGSIAAAILVIFTAVSYLSPTNFIPVIGTVVIGLIVTGYYIIKKKLSLWSALVAWIIVAIIVTLIYLLLPTLTVEVTGALVDSSRNPIEKSALVLTDSSGIDHKAITDTGGSFKINNIPEGEYSIQANNELLFGGRISSAWWERLINRTVDVGVLVYKPTPTMVPSETPAITLTPAYTPTLAKSYTSTPIPPQILSFEDFEIGVEGWGDKPSGIKLRKEAVEQKCDDKSPFSFTGICWLQYIPIRIINQDAYIARKSVKDDNNALISIHVKIPVDIDLCTDISCSTVKIIVWDKNFTSHESDYVQLDNPGEWEEITYDLSKETFSTPYEFIGIHFHIITGYAGPFYIDAVTVTKP